MDLPDLPHVHGPGHGGVLAHKVGPFPVGVWLLVIVGGLAISWYATKHANSNAAGSTDPNATDPTAGGGTSAGFDGSGGAGQGGGGVVTQTPGTTTHRHRHVTHHRVTKPPATPRYYVVRRGDTLPKIAHFHHTTALHLYRLNRQLLDATARRHGLRNSNRGHWIYPGERLLLR